MQLTINIENESLVDKVIWFLETLKDRGVEIIQKEQIIHSKAEDLSDEYIKKNWKNIVSESLNNYNESYTKSFQYKLDRAEFSDMKEAL